MTIIDFHNHFYPKQYIQALQSGPSNIKVSFDSEKNPLLYYPGDYNIIVKEHMDTDLRAKVLKEAGVDKQILSFTTPGTHIETPERSVELARMVNDSFAKITAEHSDHFTALATLPLNDPQASVVELERAFNDLGFRGVTVFSNINGTELFDRQHHPSDHHDDGRQSRDRELHPGSVHADRNDDWQRFGSDQSGPSHLHLR